MISYQKNNLISIIGAPDVINSNLYFKLNLLTKELLEEELLVFDKKILLLTYLSRSLNKAGIPNPVNLEKLITLYNSAATNMEYLNYDSILEVIEQTTKIIEEHSSTFFLLLLSKNIIEKNGAFFINNFNKPAELLFTISYNDSSSAKKFKLLFEFLKNKDTIILETAQALFDKMKFVEKDLIIDLLDSNNLTNEPILNKFIFLSKNLSEIQSHYDRTVIALITEILKESKKIEMILEKFQDVETNYDNFFLLLNSKSSAIEKEVAKIDEESSNKNGIINIIMSESYLNEHNLFFKLYEQNNILYNSENIKKYGCLFDKNYLSFNFSKRKIDYSNKDFFKQVFEKIENFYKHSRLKNLSNIIFEQNKDFYIAEVKEPNKKDFDAITLDLERMTKKDGNPISFDSEIASFDINYIINGNPNNAREIFAIMNKNMNAFSEFHDEEDDEGDVGGTIGEIETNLSSDKYSNKSATKSNSKNNNNSTTKTK